MDRMLPRCWKGRILSRSAAVEQVRAHRRREVEDEKPVVCARLVVNSIRENLPMDHAAPPPPQILQRRVYNPIRNLGMGPRAGCGLNKSRNFGSQPTAFEVATAACENCRAHVLDVQAVRILACWTSQNQQPQTGSLESGPKSLGTVHSRLPRKKGRPTKVVRFSFIGQRDGFWEGKATCGRRARRQWKLGVLGFCGLPTSCGLRTGIPGRCSCC